MATHRLIVFTESTPGKEAEYNEWYDQIHLKEVLEIEGFVAAQRFRVADAQVAGGDADALARYLAIYEIEADSVEVALEKLDASAGSMIMSDALDLDGAKAFAYTAIGERQQTL